jgi:hypothetical protein
VVLRGGQAGAAALLEDKLVHQRGIGNVAVGGRGRAGGDSQETPGGIVLVLGPAQDGRGPVGPGIGPVQEPVILVGHEQAHKILLTIDLSLCIVWFRSRPDGAGLRAVGRVGRLASFSPFVRDTGGLVSGSPHFKNSEGRRFVIFTNHLARLVIENRFLGHHSLSS